MAIEVYCEEFATHPGSLAAVHPPLSACVWTAARYDFKSLVLFEHESDAGRVKCGQLLLRQSSSPPPSSEPSDSARGIVIPNPGNVVVPAALS